jgi:type II secretory pathway pseudopilin PulG
MKRARGNGERGFSLIEVLIAILITMIVMASVMLLLQKGQRSFRREPEVSDMNSSARSGLSRVSRDLTVAGYNTPPNLAVMWQDGGGINPDELTIVYADAEIPVAWPTTIGCPTASVPRPRDARYARLRSLLDSLGLVNPLLQPAIDPTRDLLGMMQRRGGRRGGRGGRGGGGTGGGTTGGGGTGGGTTGGGGTGGGTTGGGGTGGGTTGGGGGGGVTTGACSPVGASSTMHLDPESMDPAPIDFEAAYPNGMTMFAIQGPNGDPACDAVAPAIIRLNVTQAACSTGSGSSGASACGVLDLTYTASAVAGLNPPAGFVADVDPVCAVVGMFHVVQYRVNPPPPTPEPALERRDLSVADTWSPVSANIENLQVQYTQGFGDVFQDVPAVPVASDPNTWIMGVRVTISGRSESTNLEGGSAGVFAAGDTHMRRSFSTTISLRNQLNYAANVAEDHAFQGWN